MDIKGLKMPRFSSLFRRRSKKIFSETNQSINLIEDRKPRRKISLKFPSMKFPSIKSPSIPTIPFFSFFWNRPPLSWIRKFPFRQVFGVLLLLLSILGLVVIFKNPMPWIASVFPIHLNTVGGGSLHIEQTYVQGLLNTLYTDTLVSRVALGIASFMAMLSWILLVQHPMALLKTLGRTIKRSPRAILYSPITAYKRMIIWRNWLLAKVNYLNEESAKWKRVFQVLRSPYSFLRMMGLSPQMAIGLLAVGSTAGTGVIVSETVFAERSFARGDAGVYNAPLDTPVFADDQYNTLRLDLGTTSVGNITIENISLGTAYTGSALPSGESNVIYVGGIAASSNPTFNQTYLEVGHLIIDRWRCERLDISNSEIHHLIVSGNASDGQSISAVAGTPRNRGINGGNRADDMTTSGGYYDMLKITSASSGVNGKVDVLTLRNIYSKGGACTIKYVKAGTMEVTLNEIGGDESLATKAFTIATSVIYKSFTNTSNVEVSMAVPAVQ